MTLCDVRVKLTWLCRNKSVLFCCRVKFGSNDRIMSQVMVKSVTIDFPVLSKWTIVPASQCLAEILFLNDDWSTFKSYVLNIFGPNKVSVSVLWEEKEQESAGVQSWHKQEATASLQMVSAAAWRLRCNVSSLEEERRTALNGIFLYSWLAEFPEGLSPSPSKTFPTYSMGSLPDGYVK